MKPAVFFDRDDTLVRDTGYMYKIEEFSWMNGAEAALRLLHEAGVPAFIITNQGGIARGFFTVDQMHGFHDHLCAQAIEAGGMITDIAFCPHHPLALTKQMAGPCSCRKPAPGLILQLAEKWQLTLDASIVIGDRPSDIEAGERAGCTAYQLDETNDIYMLTKKALRQIAEVKHKLS